jgi:hypothetical protein
MNLYNFKKTAAMLLVTKSFDIPGWGIIVFLRQATNGLPEHTVLQSVSRPLAWQVKCRQLWAHSAHAMPRFANEKENIGHMNFGATADIGQAWQASIARELAAGLEYVLVPVGHSEKPFEGEQLFIRQ